MPFIEIFATDSGPRRRRTLESPRAEQDVDSERGALAHFWRLGTMTSIESDERLCDHFSQSGKSRATSLTVEGFKLLGDRFQVRCYRLVPCSLVSANRYLTPFPPGGCACRAGPLALNRAPLRPSISEQRLRCSSFSPQLKQYLLHPFSPEYLPTFPAIFAMAHTETSRTSMSRSRSVTVRMARNSSSASSWRSWPNS